MYEYTMVTAGGARSSSQPSNEASPDSAESSSQLQPMHIRTSCDLCKRMKIKCERQGESCTHCIARGAKCDMTLVKRKKQIKRGNPLKDVEDRIKRIESVLFSTSGPTVDDGPADAEVSRDEAGDSPADLTDKLSTLLVTPEGSSHFLGASSGFSLFSPQGFQWISDKTGSNDFSESISRIASTRTQWPLNQTEIWHPVSPMDRAPLPAKQDADKYIACYFDTFNRVFPLYDRETFYGSYSIHYSGGSVGNSAWYASLNVVLCFGYLILYDRQRLKASVPTERIEFHEAEGWKYFKNAASCFVDLVFRFPIDLCSVQALIGMAFIQQITLDPQSYYMLIAAAGRMAYGIGLHRKLDHFGLSQSEINQRRNVFWILYFADKSISIRIGQPSVLVDDDIGIDLPQESESLRSPVDGSTEYQIFRCHAQLALLESRIYSELYSIRARNKPELQRLQAVGQLDKELLRWRDSLPIQIRPEENIQCSYEQFFPVVMLHFAYMNCVSTVHRASMNHGSWINIQSKQDGSALHDQNLNPRVYTSHSICLSAARNTIKLLQKVNDSSRNSIVRMALYYPLTAFLLLFANILQNPKGTSIASDLKLMELVTTFLNSMEPQIPFTVPASIKMFHQLYKIALRFVETNNSEKVKVSKRGYNDMDSGPNFEASSSEKKLMNSLAPLNIATTSGQENREDNSSSSLMQNTQNEQICTPEFQDFPMSFPDLPASEQLLSNDQFLYPTDMAGMPIISETVQWEWDLQNLWNGSFMPDN